MRVAAVKMGIKEFRERLGEVARGSEPVQLTDRGRVIGFYTPLPVMDEGRLRRAREAMEANRRWQEDLRGKGIETETLLAEIGLDPWGAPLAGSA